MMSASLGKAMCFAAVFVAALGVDGSVASVATQNVPVSARGSGWKHDSAVHELAECSKVNLERLKKLVEEQQQIKIGVSELMSRANAQIGLDNEPDCPDWVDSLGAGKREVVSSGEEDWIDGSAPSSPPAEEKPHFKYGDSPLDDFLSRSKQRLMEVGRQENDGPFTLRRTISMGDILVPAPDEDEFEARPKPVDEIACFLDLDKCSIYGQDGNDLSIAIQWMQGGFDKLVGLYRNLLNPQLKPLYQQLSMSVEKLPVVLYTMRPQLLRYKSAVRRQMMSLQWKREWHHSVDQVVIPPHIIDPNQILDEYTGVTPLHIQEKQDLYMSFQRLLAIREVIKTELGLESNPPIVVAAVMKDVQGTAKKLGLKPEKSYLWDDNEVLKGQPHVLTVEPYVAMDSYCRKRLLDYMEKQMPANQLAEDAVEFMMGAKPDSCSIKTNLNGGLEYTVNHSHNHVQRFPIPDLPVRYSTPIFVGRQVESLPIERKGVTQQRMSKYCGSIVEYYTAAWRRDGTQAKAREQWDKQCEMVW